MFLEENTLKISYGGEGERIKSHQMPASFVASSILATEALLKEAQNEANRIYRIKTSTEVCLDGAFNDGSLWWLLRVFGKANEQQEDIDEKTSFHSILSAICKVVDVLKLLPLEEAEIIIKQSDATGFEVEIDNERVALDELETALLTNPIIRESISNIVSPLSDEGISEVTLNSEEDRANSITITEADKQALIVKRGHRQIIDEGSRKGFYYIDTLSYDPKNKWKVIPSEKPKQKPISVSIVDGKFLKDVSEGIERFSKNDLIEVDLSWIIEKDKLTGKNRSTYTIKNVIQHVPANIKQQDIIL